MKKLRERGGWMEAQRICKEEVRAAMIRSENGVSSDGKPVKIWKCIRERAADFLMRLFNTIVESEKMPEEWKRSGLIPIFEKKCDMQS